MGSGLGRDNAGLYNSARASFSSPKPIASYFPAANSEAILFWVAYLPQGRDPEARSKCDEHLLFDESRKKPNANILKLVSKYFEKYMDTDELAV
jgi:hypothetical protein